MNSETGQLNRIRQRLIGLFLSDRSDAPRRGRGVLVTMITMITKIELELGIERGRPGDQHELVGAALGPDAVLRGLANLAADEAVGGQSAALDQPPDRELDVLLGRAVGDETIDDLAHGHAGVRVSFDDGEHGVLQMVGHGAASMDRGREADKVCAPSSE